MLSTLFKFCARFAIAYLIVFFGTILIWEIFGVTDREGGKGLALAFFIAPVTALFGTIAWPMVSPMLVRAMRVGKDDTTNDSSNEEKKS